MVQTRKRAAEAAPSSTPAAEQPSTSEEAGPSKVVYVGHIPHGFYEKQMREYFTQFGKISKLRLSRSKKTGNSKHYAFLEFGSAEVARIVAETMDGYMMLSQKLQVRVMPRAEVHADLFKGANRVFKKMPWKKIELQRQNKDRSEGEERVRLGRALRRDAQRAERIAKAGIEYEYEGLAAALPPRPKKTKFAD